MNASHNSISESGGATASATSTWIMQAVRMVGAPLASRVAFTHPMLLVLGSYVLLLLMMYLFHSPFRVQVACRADWYAQVTRTAQVWCAVVFLCFHMGPFALHYDDGEKTELAHTDMAAQSVETDISPKDTLAVVFFSTYCTLYIFFQFLHKMKRRLGLGVTYGPGFVIVVLNSILLSIFSTMHYVACDVFLRDNSYKLCPTRVTEHLFSAIASLMLLNMVFIALDYGYKKMRGFNPSRGILWSELYEPISASKRIRSWVLESGEGGGDGADAKHDFRRSVPPLHRIPIRECRKGKRRHSILYGAAASVAVSNCTSKADATTTTSRAALPQSLNAQHTMPRHLETSQVASTTAPLSMCCSERFDFSLSTREMDEVRAVKHPLNAPGMVQWFSTFIASTTWQNVARGALDFLTFDVRGLQGFARPKVFSLSFTNSVAACCEDTLSSLSNPTPGLHRDSRITDGATDRGALHSLPVSFAGMTTDVWFDWVADVGDGFNPTYEIAQLLAQPALKTEEAASSRATARTNSSDRKNVIRVVRADGCETRYGGASPKCRSDPTSPRTNYSPPQPLFPKTAGNSLSERSTESREDPQRTLGLVTPLQVGFHSEDCHGQASDAHTKSCSPPRLLSHTLDAASRCNSTRDMTSNNVPGTGGEDDSRLLLPRGSFVLIGGDLAYPTPSDETYQRRLFGPYSDALRGNLQLRQLFHREQQRIVVQDETDRDMAHIRMLDAATVAGIAMGDDPLRSSRGTAEEALRSIPMLFSIPGNHDWYDGLTTFRKYILEKTWIGGWLMPQRSSFFLLKLPHNWFIICCDTGTTEDIDTAQRNYFLDCIEKYMDGESCVILTCHEPDWIYETLFRRESPFQPELNKVAVALGTRVRLRLCGDIHNYSRHTPRDPLSESPMLVVSGGGGGFMHGPRRAPIVAHGIDYVRAEAFPRNHAFMPVISRLFGFRLINWKFDLIIGVLSFLMIFSVLPQPYYTTEVATVKGIVDFISVWFALTWHLACTIFSKGIVSLIDVIAFFAAFYGGSGANVSVWACLLNGIFWTACVLFTCCGMLGYMNCLVGYMANNSMIMSHGGRWGSVIEDQARSTTDVVLNHTRAMLGLHSVLARDIEQVQLRLYGSWLVRAFGFLMRCLDPIETLAYLSVKVSSPTLGTFDADATRTEMVLYYLNFIFFYWVLVTPLVSSLIGSYLFFTSTVFDTLYDAVYSAFQIEDYKNFLRFRIDSNTRELHCYVIAEEKVPRLWERDPQHVAELARSSTSLFSQWRTTGGRSTSDTAEDVSSHGAESTTPPSHLQRHPSRWRAILQGRTLRKGGRNVATREGTPILLEHFVCRPHRTGDTPTGAAK